jgi:DNA-directed RNA polymerase sigma subunit (sigma70/sigma32)
MGTTKEAWQQLKNNPVKYEQTKKQIIECRRKKRLQEQAVFLDLQREAFLTNIYNWDRDKHLLSDTYRQVLAWYYGLDGTESITLTEIALKLGVSKQCVANKRDRAIKNLVKLQSD